MNIYFVCINDRPHANHMARSFKKQMPDCGLIQMSTPDTKKVDGVDSVIEVELQDKKNVMLYMMDCFSRIKDEEFITTADDCILDKPVYEILEGDFDVSIAKIDDRYNWRLRVPIIYTNGLVGVKNKYFYKDCFDKLYSLRYEPYRNTNLWEWYGDMVCIERVLMDGKYKVKELDCVKYCKKPEFDGDGGAEGISMYHYAKRTKGWMKNHGKGLSR